MHKSRKILFMLIFLVLPFVFSQVNSRVYAHATGLNHLQCGYGTTPQVDNIQADIQYHNLAGVIPTAAWDGYIYDNGPTDPIAVRHPTGPPGTQLWIGVISQPPAATYTAKQFSFESPTLTCNYVIQCKSNCDPVYKSGACDNSCNIDVVGVSCPRYNGNYAYAVKTGGDATTINWNDGGPNDILEAQPTDQTVYHTFRNAGKYDVLVYCGARTCHARFNATCQGQGGFQTPTPLPTASPTPTGYYPCITPLVCAHPCVCNQGVSSYVAGDCSNRNSTETSGYKGGYGTTAGNTEGAACAPGLVCCQPQTSSSAWFKTKDASYHEQGLLDNNIPSNASPFNGSDLGLCKATEPGSLACHGINFPGLLSAQGNITLGSGVANFNLWSYGDASYLYAREFTPDTIIQYMRARRETVTIADPEQVLTNKVNYIDGAQTILEIDNNGMQGSSPFVLLVDNGDLLFDLAAQFNPSNAPMAIIVDGTIRFKSSIKEVNGIFIANDFDFAFDTPPGSTNNNDLWINGNIISMNDVNCIEKRVRTDDNTKPSCFFTLDFVNQYLPLLNLFSTRTFSRSSS